MSILHYFIFISGLCPLVTIVSLLLKFTFLYVFKTVHNITVIILEALPWIISKIAVCFLQEGHKAPVNFSRWGLIIDLCYFNNPTDLIPLRSDTIRLALSATS